MSDPQHALLEHTATAELQRVLEHVLSRHLRARRRVVELRRTRSAYRTSHALEELDVRLDDGTTLALMAKDLQPRALHAAARAAGSASLRSPVREIRAYRVLKGDGPLATATCYGAVLEPPRYWLFLERVAGEELYQVGEPDVWQEVARRLARFHRQHAAPGALERITRSVAPIEYDAAFYRTWMRRAQQFVQRRAHGRDRIRAFRRLAAGYERVVARLCHLPATFIHGECYASNVLVLRTPGGLRVCPVDWETAAVGPGAIDLAALVAGGWTEAQKRALALAYFSAWMDGEEPDGGTETAFLDALDHCRLHIAVQWLGWSPSWEAPPEHRHDWLAEALRLADRLAL